MKQLVVVLLVCFFLCAKTTLSAEQNENCSDDLDLMTVLSWDSLELSDDPLMPMLMFTNPDTKATIQEVYVTFGNVTLEGSSQKETVPLLMQYRNENCYCFFSIKLEPLPSTVKKTSV